MPKVLQRCRYPDSYITSGVSRRGVRHVKVAADKRTNERAYNRTPRRQLIPVREAAHTLLTLPAHTQQADDLSPAKLDEKIRVMASMKFHQLNLMKMFRIPGEPRGASGELLIPDGFGSSADSHFGSNRLARKSCLSDVIVR